MNYLNKLERKIGKYAIPNLSLWLVVTYALGYLMMYMTPGIISYLMLEPAMVLRGQVWRLVTWVLIPPSTGNIFFYIIMIMLYYSLGTALERTWGTFRFNVYIFGGLIFTVIGAFVAYGFLSMTGGLTIGIGYYVTVLHQYGDLSGICSLLPGYADPVVVHHSGKDEVDGICLCSSDHLRFCRIRSCGQDFHCGGTFELPDLLSVYQKLSEGIAKRSAQKVCI